MPTGSIRSVPENEPAQSEDPVRGVGRVSRRLAPAQEWERRRYESITDLVIRVAVVLVGFDYVVLKGASIGLIVAIALLPMWLPFLRKHTLATSICLLGLASVPCGYLLARSVSFDHAIDPVAQVSWFGLLLSGLAAMAVVLWARQRFPLHEVILLYAVGALVDVVLFSSRSWKFDLAVPVILLVTSLAERFGKELIAIALLSGLGVFSAFKDGRSLLGFCAIAATLALWQRRPSHKDGGTNRWMPVALIVGVALGLYLLVSSLLTAGVFGEALQERSVSQIETSGNLISGGRPEWAATRELVKLRPIGFGTGVVPSWSELQAGKAGLQSINVYAEGYAENFMFARGYELHSILADLWVSFGISGLALGVVMLIALLRSMSFRLAARGASPSVLFACVLGVWYLLFGPIYSNWVEVSVAVGLSLVTRDGKPDPVAVVPVESTE